MWFKVDADKHFSKEGCEEYQKIDEDGDGINYEELYS